MTALPYALILAALLLTVVVDRMEPDAGRILWHSGRLMLRIVGIGGTVTVWWMARSRPRPLWLYSWLGYALYEVTGLLLVGTMFSFAQLTQVHGAFFLLGLMLAVFSFVPWIVAVTWIG